MKRWNLSLWTRFGLRREQPKARRSPQTVKLNLEALEDRTLLSVSPGNPQPVDAAASSQPASQVAPVASYVRSALEQWGHWVITV